MKSINQWLDQYSESHQHPLNKQIHWVCIPLIVISLLGLLMSFRLPWGPSWLDPALLLLAMTSSYYASLSTPLAVGMILMSAGMYLGACVLSLLPGPLWLSSMMLFILAWAGQFMGHRIEGKKPSFFQDIQFLLIGPLWSVAAIYRRLGIPY